MFVILGIGLVGGIMLLPPEPPDIAGQWTGEDWGTVVLKQTKPAEYTGTYTDTFGTKPGAIQLKWSRTERRFTGTWREGEDRFGKISVRQVGDEIRGAWTTNRKSEINPGTPELADLLWVRGKADSHWVFAPAIGRTLICSGSKLRNEALRLDDGKMFNLPKNMSHEEQEKWRNETRVNFAIDYLPETDQWEMKLRNVQFAELSDGNWETLGADELQERFPKLEWKKATNAETDQKEKGFYSLIFTKGMKPPMTFAFETSAGQRGIFQFYATNKTAAFRNALIRYKQVQRLDTPVNTKGDGGKTTPNSLPRQMFRLHTKNRVSALAYSPDGNTLAIGGDPEMVGLFEARTGKPLTSLKSFSKEEKAILAAANRAVGNVEVRALAFSQDSTMLAVGTSIGQVKLFDARTGAFTLSLDGVLRKVANEKALPKFLELRLAQGNVWAVAFSPDGKLLATCGDAIDYNQDGISRLGLGPTAGLLKLWDAKTGELKRDLKAEHSGQVLDVAFSPDGKFLASAGHWALGTGVKLWDPQTGKVTKVLAIPNGHLGGGSPLCFGFSPDGKRLAMGIMKYDKSTDVTSGAINVVYPASGILDLSWLVPRSMRPVAFSPDGKTIAAISAKSTLTLWDSSTGLPQREIRPTGQPDNQRWECFAFAPKDNMLAIGGIDFKTGGFVEVWDLNCASAEGK